MIDIKALIANEIQVNKKYLDHSIVDHVVVDDYFIDNSVVDNLFVNNSLADDLLVYDHFVNDFLVVAPVSTTNTRCSCVKILQPNMITSTRNLVARIVKQV
jgi:hypothetical protein